MAAADATADGKQMYEALRSQVLNAMARGLPSTGNLGGLVVDVPAGSDGFATVVALGDGTASMYLSTGGGVIGAGTHENVATALRATLELTDNWLDYFRADPDTSHPPNGLARLFALTREGRRIAEVPVDAFWGKETHVLMPLIASVQNLITAIRKASPST